MSQLAHKYYTPEEYLALEAKAKYKSEYRNGQIYAMAGGTPNHNTIALNISAELRTALRGSDCQAFNSDTKINIPPANYYTYPDAAVVCGELKFADKPKHSITNPLVIIEVLSESTKDNDTKQKFELYRKIESFMSYVLIDQTRVYIEHHQKLENDKWLTEFYSNIEQTLRLPLIEVEIPLVNIYERVTFLDNTTDGANGE